MKTTRAILTGTLVWILGVGVFTTSFYIPMINDLELQANIALALALAPLAILGARNFYYRYPNMPGYKLALIMAATAVVLDALITVPVLYIPAGGSYTSFFGSLSFWSIATEYFLVVMLYWHFKVKAAAQKSFS